MCLIGVLPSLVILVLIWRSNVGKREPARFLRKLFLYGALTVISAFILGEMGENIYGSLDKNSILFFLIDNFIGVAMVEEGGKFFVLKKFTWKSSNFNYTYSAVLYAVIISLGFATIENVFYMIDSDLFAFIIRAVFSVPGHAIFGVFMGEYYAKAKVAETYGDKKHVRQYLTMAYLVPVLLHGLDDFLLDCVHINTWLFLFIYLVFEITVIVVGIKTIKRLVREDTAIYRNIQLPWFLNKREIAYYSSSR
ncbi:MAG: PrsW family intramembrane metalloprotease [Eubacterium sp.]|nr:PrsW family intramembrane metalloprotease [Eubacterium sp.]